MPRRFAATALLLLSCASPPPPPPAPTCAPGTAGVPLAFALRAPDGREAYLQGSMHFVKGAPPALHPRAQAALRDADLLVLEIDPDDVKPEQVAQTLVEIALLPEGKRLRDVLTPETWQTLETRAKETNTDLAPVEVFEPWVVAFGLIVGSITQGGFAAEGGTEQVAIGSASAKETLGLETVRDQLDLFDSLSLEEQEHLLVAAMEGNVNNAPYLEALADAWRCGDVAGLEAAIGTEESAHPSLSAFYDALIYERNVGMARGIQSILRDRESAFFVVGAAHLVGARGIPALLEQAGFQVEQLRRQP